MGKTDKVGELNELRWQLHQAETELNERIRATFLEVSQLQLKVDTLRAQMEGLQEGAYSPSLSMLMKAKLDRDNNAGRPTKSRHPFPRRVGNVKKWAEERGYSYALVKSWYNEGKNPPAPVPFKAAQSLLKDYDIPLSAWRGGIGKPE